VLRQPSSHRAGSLGHRADESLVLDRPDDRGRGPGVADVAQPGEPVRPVEQVGVPLIGAEGLDEQPPPVIGDGHERPRTLRDDPGRLDGGDGQRAGPQRGRDPLGSDPSVRHAEYDQRPRRRSPRETNARTSSAGRTVPVTSRAVSAAPSAIHAVRRQGRLSHGAAATVTAAAAASKAAPGKRCAGQPGAMPGRRRYRMRVLVADQIQDACHLQHPSS
jgi:hypothetical protein